MSRDEDYVTVHATLLRRTDKAAQVENDFTDKPVWVPRSCMHFATDRAIDAADLGAELELKLMSWVAVDRGLA